MAYDIYYHGACDVAVPDHYCNDCEDTEKARVSAVAFIKDGFEFNDPSSPTEWQEAIDNKQVVIIPRTNGSYDGGSEVEATGYGRQATKLTGYNFTVNYNDPNYKNNADFYNAIKRSLNYRFAFLTETLIHMVNTTVSVVPHNPVSDDINADVVWAVTVKWADGDLPVPYDIPAGIFTCFDYTGSIG